MTELSSFGQIRAWLRRPISFLFSGKFALLRRLLRENARFHVRAYLVAFALMAISALTTAASAWIMRDVINEIFVGRNAEMVVTIALSVMAIYAVKGASVYGQTVLMSRIGNDIVARNQKRLFRHMLTQGMEFFQRTSMADMATRMSHNANAVRDVLDLIITSIGRDLVTLISLVTVMVVQDPFLSISALLIMPPAVIGVGYIVRRVRYASAQEFLSVTQIVSHVHETFGGIRIVKAFGLEPKITASVDEAVESVEARANKIAGLTARTSPLMEALGGFAIAVVILYGGWSIIHWGGDAGAFMSFITALLLAYEPAKRLARLNVQLEVSLVGVEMFFDLLDRPARLLEHPDAQPLQTSAGAISFDKVVFSYGGKPVISNLSVDFPARSVTALIGPSGAGKSTLFALIERFYDPTKGTISIDGQDICGVTLSSLHEAIALVTQETFLFDTTIRNNILYGRLDATEEEIVEAAKAANAHDFITEFGQGYNTPVGEGGGKLSGGQRQRIAIARAMLRNAPILLLDEATSALDAQSEAAVQQALDRLMEGRTTLVIAHRLSTVRNADQLFVMDRGVLVETGTHQELLAEGGLYAQLYRLQFAGSSTEVPAISAAAVN